MAAAGAGPGLSDSALIRGGFRRILHHSPKVLRVRMPINRSAPSIASSARAFDTLTTPPIAAVVFAFAQDVGEVPPHGAAPFAVQARQIPRLLVATLNGEQGVELRFFPFMGQQEGERRFFNVAQLFGVDQLRKVHGQAEVGLLVDGRISATSITMRIHQAREGGSTLAELEVDYDPLDPWPALRHLLFELTGRIDWLGQVPELPNWSGATLGWYLIARDDQLAIEASMPTPDVAQRLRAAREAVLLAPGDGRVVSTLLESCRALSLRGSDREEGDDQAILDAVGDALLEVFQVVDGPTVSAAKLVEAARLVEACKGVSIAIPLFARAAKLDPAEVGAAVKAGFGLHAMGRTEEAREILRATYQAGHRNVALQAQLAAAEEQCGNREERDRILDELIAKEQLPEPIARLVASSLTDRDRPGEALELLERASFASSSYPGIWLERGRAQLSLGRPEEAARSLERCMALEPSPEMRAEARRLQRLAGDSDLLPSIRMIESELQQGRVRGALRLARRLVGDRPALGEAHLLLGTVLQRAERTRRAIVSFRRALELQPDLGDAHNRLGVLLLVRGEIETGYEHLLRATELMPHDASAWLHLAQAYRLLGQFEQAIEALDRSEQIGGYDLEVSRVRRHFDGRSESA